MLGLHCHFQELKPNVKRGLSVPSNLQTGNIHIFKVEGLAMSDLFYMCFGDALGYESHVQEGTPFLP